MVGTLRQYKISKEKIFESENKNEKLEEKKQNKKSGKPAGRPKKDEVCNKKIIIYFTEKEYNEILQKAGSIAASPFLKNIILDNLK